MRYVALLMLVGLLAVSVVGCKKEEPAPTPSETIGEVKMEAEKTAEEVKKAAEEAPKTAEEEAPK